MSARQERKAKSFPRYESDAEAEHLVETADLFGYDFTGFRPAGFEFQPKAAQINMRMPKSLLDAVKESARQRGIRYTRYIRELVEQDVLKS